MKKRKTILLICWVVSLMACGSAEGRSLNRVFGEKERPFREEPRFQAAFGFDFRIDDLNKHSYVPSVVGRFYYFFHPIVAIRAGLAHNSLTRLEGGMSYHTVAFDAGFRINAREKLLIPFLETGVWLPIYWGTDRGNRYTDFQPGLRFAAGLSVGVTPGIAFDFCLTQVLNHIDLPGTIPPPLAPEPHGYYRYSPDLESAYNPATAEFTVRMGL